MVTVFHGETFQKPAPYQCHKIEINIYIYIYVCVCVFPGSNYNSKDLRNHTIDLHYHIHHLTFLNNGLGQIVKILFCGRQASIVTVVTVFHGETFQRPAPYQCHKIERNRQIYIYMCVCVFPGSNYNSKDLRNHTIDLHYHIHHLTFLNNGLGQIIKILFLWKTSIHLTCSVIC